MPKISGISRTSLWTAWKDIRRETRQSAVRDVIDFLEYDIDPDRWINQLLHEIEDGSYEPAPPFRFELAKSKGFSRRMTAPTIRDIVLYRALTAHCYRRAKRAEEPYVFFEQARLDAAARVAAGEAREEMQREQSSYGYSGRRRWQAWLSYDEYRRRLIMQRTYPFLVVTDITNFFDSVLYGRIADALSGRVDARATGLLFFLLERLSIREAFTESPRVGLPVDEFDGSRRLAHLVLFPHDHRMAKEFGREAYVRWMDDQLIGVASRAAGFRALASIGHSLSRLHLTPNGGKSRVLSLAQARDHFHLNTNAAREGD